ncbi:MAG: DNA polymerase III subunit epsilon [Hyphomicrobiales bacterium]|nr:MAG: DNA polymerase III subunit epsilon [Hyphomicrobiales bacterium]
MREIVLDTETTGLDPIRGDRIVEIGCVELVNHIPSGQNFHIYINPERSMPIEAFNVHGLSEEFLSDKPKFAEIADEFLDFVTGARLIIHNAAFDMGFINAELGRLKHPAIPNDYVVDTLQIARRRHPAGPNSLDALCSRYGIDNSRRTHHGALLDAELLAEVYIELIGGKQAALGFGEATNEEARAEFAAASTPRRAATRPAPLPSRVSEAERAAHAAFVETLGDDAMWKRYGRG